MSGSIHQEAGNLSLQYSDEAVYDLYGNLPYSPYSDNTLNALPNHCYSSTVSNSSSDTKNIESNEIRLPTDANYEIMTQERQERRRQRRDRSKINDNNMQISGRNISQKKNSRKKVSSDKQVATTPHQTDSNEDKEVARSTHVGKVSTAPMLSLITDLNDSDLAVDNEDNTDSNVFDPTKVATAPDAQRSTSNQSDHIEENTTDICIGKQILSPVVEENSDLLSLPMVLLNKDTSLESFETNYGAVLHKRRSSGIDQMLNSKLEGKRRWSVYTGNRIILPESTDTYEPQVKDQFRSTNDLIEESSEDCFSTDSSDSKFVSTDDGQVDGVTMTRKTSYAKSFEQFVGERSNSILKSVFASRKSSFHQEYIVERTNSAIYEDPEKKRQWFLASNLLRRQLFYFVIIMLPVLLVFAIIDYVALASFNNIGNGTFFGLSPQDWLNRCINFSQSSFSLLNIILTIVSFILQLSATRYNSNVIELFFRDKTNGAILQIYIANCLIQYAVTIEITENFIPSALLTAAMLLLALCIGLLIPYFRYIFAFISPLSQILTVQKLCLAQLWSDRSIDVRQTKFLKNLQLLQDFIIASVSNNDSVNAHNSLLAVKTIAIEVIECTNSVDESFFKFGRAVASNDDFQNTGIAIEVKAKRIWPEYKLLSIIKKAYIASVSKSISNMEEISRESVFCVFQIGLTATDNANKGVLHLVFKFFNTFLRISAQANDANEMNKILFQYRNLGFYLLQKCQFDEVLTIFGFFRYYSFMGYNCGLLFVTENIAYDMAFLLEEAYRKNSPHQELMLRIFLDVDRVLGDETENDVLRGVRKAQMKLGCFYMQHDEIKLAKIIRLDMSKDSDQRLLAIKYEILSITDKRDWEVGDRGFRIDYLDSSRRLFINDFLNITNSPEKEEHRFARKRSEASNYSGHGHNPIDPDILKYRRASMASATVGGLAVGSTSGY